METHVQQQLLNELSAMRYNPGPTTHAKRPGNKEKLPAGTSYTCSAEGSRVGLLDEMGGTGDSDESSSEEERSKTVRKIIKRLSSKRPCQVEENEQEEEVMLKRFLRLTVTTIRTWSTLGRGVYSCTGTLCQKYWGAGPAKKNDNNLPKVGRPYSTL